MGSANKWKCQDLVLDHCPLFRPPSLWAVQWRWRFFVRRNLECCQVSKKPAITPSLDGSFSATTFTISNLCPDTVWPGLLSGAGTPPLSPSGFSLNSGDSRSLQIPPSWSGRLWARTHCSSDPTTSKFTCATGDCGSGLTDCSGHGADPPATLAEFTLDGSDGLDFFDVSLVDGYNLPMIITPVGVTGGGGNCTSTGCAVDLNGSCPSDLTVVLSGSEGRGVACRSACGAFDTPEFCCSGDYGNPKTCRPSSYSEFFKEACPQAYSYAYDDASSTFTCPAGGNYLITFCPSTSRQKAGKTNSLARGIPLINDTMVFLGPVLSRAAVPANPFSAFVVLVIVAGLATWWGLFL